MHESIGKIKVNAERQSLVPQLVPSIAQASTAKQPQRGHSSRVLLCLLHKETEWIE